MESSAGEYEKRSLVGRLSSTAARYPFRARKAHEKKKVSMVKKLSPLNRFRALVRKVCHSLVFLGENNESRKKMKKEMQMFNREDMLILKRAVRPLNELQNLSLKLSYLKPFHQYSESVRLQLLKLVDIEYYEEGRVIIRQGHEPQAMYFVVGGSVIATTTFRDPMFPDEIRENVDKFMAGDTFGETALLYREPHVRTAVASKAGVLVLILKKEDFRAVLQHTVESQWNAIRWGMSRFHYFKNFSEEAKRVMCGSATLDSKPPNVLLPVVDVNGIEIVTFLLHGTLRVIEKVLIETIHVSDIEIHHRAFENQDLDSALMPKNVKAHYFETCKLYPQAVFGLGEVISKHHVMTEYDSLVMVIPRYVLFRYNIANIWNRVTNIVNLNYPEVNRIVEVFVQNRQRNEYRKKLYKTLYKPKGWHSRMTIHDTSVSIRAQTMRLNDAIHNKVTSRPEYKQGTKLFCQEEYAAIKKKYRRRPTTLGRLQ